MAAQTGKSYIPITPANLGAGFPRCDGVGNGLLEASVQTQLKGAPVQLSAGYIVEGSSIPQTIYGFARIAGQNGASDGAKTPSVYKALEGQQFIGTFEGTFTNTHVGASAMLSKSLSSWFIKISTAASASYNVVIRGLANSKWAIADVNPEILFSLIGSKVQGDN